MPANLMFVPTTCPECHKSTDISVDIAGYRAWKCGQLIQHALPSLPAPQREQLITGICPSCWDIIFKDDSEEPREAEGQYAGFSEPEWKLYADDIFHFEPPPIPTANWDDESWMAYIFGPRA